MDFLNLLELLLVPIIGAVIGLFTNFIAVKMLFRPYKPVYIGKLRLPFTPGIIPSRQKALGKALGTAISESLIRKEDLKKALLSDAFSDTVVNGILSLPSLRATAESLYPEEYEEKREWLLEKMADKIIAGVKGMDLGATLTAEANDVIKAFASKNPLVGIFLTESTMNQLTAPLGEKFLEFLDGTGREKLLLALSEELDKFEDKPVNEWMTNTESFAKFLKSLYQRIVERHADAIASHFQIAQTVEDKVNAMPAEQLEELVLSVMKKELNAIIGLGGVIGFLLGLLNFLTPYFA
ncbi:MAG: DUF445 family protein [Ruminococcaceae bacterium]|nr:DUF445 family protein [Oscillospiraceae bacterium]